MDEQQLQLQIVQLVQAAMQGNQEATQLIQQIMQAAQQGNLQAAQVAQMIQQVAQQMQSQQVRAAKFGAKLNYIRQLRGQCPEGYKMEYYKQGGQLCKKCMKVQKEGGEMKQPSNPVDAFKCGRKMKKKTNGGSIKKEIRTSNERDGESGSYTVTRKLTVNPATNDSTMTISGRPGQKPETINNKTTKKHYWNSEVRDWKNSKKK